jgi:hypothetical protein
MQSQIIILQIYYATYWCGQIAHETLIITNCLKIKKIIVSKYLLSV